MKFKLINRVIIMEKLNQTEIDTVTGAGLKLPNITTLALGEEGGGFFPSKPPNVTTLAIGEEDGGLSPNKPPNLTTLALGEEDGGLCKLIEKITPFGQF